MLTGIDPVTPFTWLFAAYIVFGIGFGLVNAPITNAAGSGMPRAQAGRGISYCVDLAGSSARLWASPWSGALVASGAAGAGVVKSSFTSASHAAWWTLSACGAVVLVLGVVATSRRALESARRTAAERNPEALGPAQEET